jgi:hypothetical protein
MSMSLPEPAGAGEPSSAGEALQMAVTGLGWLAQADLASVPVPVQAGSAGRAARTCRPGSAVRPGVRTCPARATARHGRCWRGRGPGPVMTATPRSPRS